MKKKYVFISMGIILVLTVIVSGVLLVNSFNKDKQEMLENGYLINESYDKVKSEVINYNQMRVDIASLIDNFYYSTIVNEYEENLDKFKKYDDIVNNITKEINVIDGKCNQIYQDKKINNICNNYKVDYETIVNVFVNDINNYNNKLSNYNKDEEKNLELFKSNYINNYIDYNNDSVYLKKDDING